MVRGPLLVEERRFGEVVARARAGVGVDAGQLAVAVGGEQASTRANSSPGHISLAVDAQLFGWTAWAWKVVQRNAPGAISAMAFTVIPVSVRLFFISPPGALMRPSLLVANDSRMAAVARIVPGRRQP